MKIKVKAAFPYSLTEILKEKGISPKLSKMFLSNFPADYRKGAVRRYIRPPEVGDTFKLIRDDLNLRAVPLFSHPASEALFVGTQEECKQVVTDALRRWWSLPKGRELEAIILEHIERRKAAKKGRRKS